MPDRMRRIEPSDPGGEPVCLLTRDEAMRRRVRPDVFFDHVSYSATDDGYNATLPASDVSWEIANTFAEEESRCCPAFAFEISERQGTIVVRASAIQPTE